MPEIHPNDVQLTSVRNRGELAEGWYDSGTLQKAKASAASLDQGPIPQKRLIASPVCNGKAEDGEGSDEEELGPSLPSNTLQIYKRGQQSGPSVPNTQDLEMQRGMAFYATALARAHTNVNSELEQENARSERENLRFDRRQDRRAQKERLEELVPRAETGSKDRVLEKKREKAEANRVFASTKTEAGGVEEVPETDLLGDEDGGLEGFKKRKTEMERKKNERELRREAILRERAEEREERVRAYREKEAKTMSGLVALAKARFG